MRLSNAAIGLAAIGAGLLVARMMRTRQDADVAATPEPPDPDQLIGTSPGRQSAAEAAQVLRRVPPRPS